MVVMPYAAHAKRLLTPVVRHSLGQRAALRFAAARRRALVLLYHRIIADGTMPRAIVPSVSVTMFRQQLEAILEIGDIVPLADLLRPPDHADRPRFAITFDDDHAGYVTAAVPALQALRVPATFFLSGRSLHGLAPYWWSFLEESIASRGLDDTCRMLGLERSSVAQVAVLLEDSPLTARLTETFPFPSEPAMSASDIRALVRAGMTVGFHTLHHPVLTRLAPDALDAALVSGRRQLADVAGTRIDLLAYPHGRADADVAAAAERSGYVAAFVTGGRPVATWSDRFLLSRWEPGPLDARELTAAAALRLLRTATRPRHARQLARAR